MKILYILVAIATVMTTSGVFAEDAAEPNESIKLSNALFGKFGFETKVDIKGTSCKTSMKLIQKTFMDNIEAIQKLELINPDLSKEKINSEPNTISFAFVMQMLPVVTKAVFEDHKEVDNCQFVQSLVVIDDYGNDQERQVVSYGFNRATYKRVNWDNLKNLSLMKIATRFHISTDFAASVQSEISQ